jgi:hypothetical protein
MANYVDGMDGGKHNSDETEVLSQETTYEVVLRFTDISAKNPLEATKKILKWIKEDAENMIYEVTNEKTDEGFTVDLSEGDEDAVLPLDVLR